MLKANIAFANDILIRNGPLALISDQDYHYTDDRPSISEIKEEQAFIRQHMISLKTHPEKATQEQSDAIVRALYNLLDDSLKHLEVSSPA